MNDPAIIIVLIVAFIAGWIAGLVVGGMFIFKLNDEDEMGGE